MCVSVRSLTGRTSPGAASPNEPIRFWYGMSGMTIPTPVSERDAVGRGERSGSGAMSLSWTPKLSRRAHMHMKFGWPESRAIPFIKFGGMVVLTFHICDSLSACSDFDCFVTLPTAHPTTNRLERRTVCRVWPIQCRSQNRAGSRFIFEIPTVEPSL